MRWLTVLIWFVAVVFTLMAVFGAIQPFLWHWLFPTQPVPEGAALLSDWLPTMFAILALGVAALGGGTYYILSRRIQDDAARIAEMRSQRAMAVSFCNHAFSYWEHYKHTRDDLKNPDLFFLNEAITVTNDAYNLHAVKLNEKERENEEVVCTILNNLGYYLAERKRHVGTSTPGDSELAKRCADYIGARITKYPDHAATWGDTIQFIRRQFSSS